MKLIIAGSRSWSPSDEAIDAALRDGGFGGLMARLDEVVCGMAKGADMAGYAYAKARGIPITEIPANWEKFGEAAGPLRNQEMALYASHAVIFWDGTSGGAANMHTWMGALNKRSRVYTKERIRIILGNPKADVGEVLAEVAAVA